MHNTDDDATAGDPDSGRPDADLPAGDGGQRPAGTAGAEYFLIEI